MEIQKTVVQRTRMAVVVDERRARTVAVVDERRTRTMVVVEKMRQRIWTPQGQTLSVSVAVIHPWVAEKLFWEVPTL